MRVKTDVVDYWHGEQQREMRGFIKRKKKIQNSMCPLCLISKHLL